MSIIQQRSPLNLVGKVAVVTSAATPLGAQTCRTLLRHNCLVLGIDDVPIPESERLFSTLGTHFQTLQMTLDGNDVIQRIVEYIEERFWKQGFDFLITFDKIEGIYRVITDIGSGIIESGCGLVLNVVDDEQSDHFVGVSMAKNGPRTNVVLKKSFTDDDGQKRLALPEEAISEVQECFARFSESVAEDVDTAKGNKALGDLLLYLVSSLGESMNGAVVAANGRWTPLSV